ncbi:SirB2 family protein [Paucibacter sp. TC2R-5]|uniref:SirB2 family protein n=1 Tax=Paucibacter sp. TC2R-5 TaxID=2893555 RepID=UPI0021E39668|nr:SirB2 family protein [Paucibacter sp. TC2R-5]MCV2360090.1 SirB2 family protein [Paucibacter sp. TC2R-5]
MGYSFDFQMGQIHAVLAWASVVMFLVRGLLFQFGAPWVMDERVRTLVFGIDFLLTITGLSLWVLLYLNPFLRDGWLLAKLLALAAYTFSAHMAMGSNRFHLPAYFVSLLLLAYMVAVSVKRSPWLGL